MDPTAFDPEARARLRAELEALDGVRCAVVDRESSVYVISDSPASPADLQVRSLLASHGYPVADADIQVAYLPAPEPRRRVRFVAASVETTGTGARGRVQLEWDGETYVGTASGEAGAAMELRLCASAALAALDRILPDGVQVQLLGVKNFRAFDTDLVVVLLRHAQAGALVGSAVDPGDPVRSAALAVLNATNRVLGNYLVSPAD